jgi:hypothetical protein
MKKKVANYLAHCLECQKVKVEQKHPSGLLHLLSIPKWKWEVVTIDFITKLPIIVKQHDSNMVVVDKLIKATNFIPAKLTHKVDNIENIYMREISMLHGVLKTIVSDRDPKFTSKFSKGLFKGVGTSLNFITSYNLESYGKT